MHSQLADRYRNLQNQSNINIGTAEAFAVVQMQKGRGLLSCGTYAPIAGPEQRSTVSSPAGFNKAALSACMGVKVSAQRCPTGASGARVDIQQHYLRTGCWAEGQF